MRNRVKEIVYCGLFSGLIMISAFIKIPTPLVPITLQTLFVLLTGLLLPRRAAILAITIYLIAGLIGLPVFTNGGGIGYIFQPTFGYLIGFLLAAIFISIMKRNQMSFCFKLILCLVALGIIYLVGISYFLVLQLFYFGKTFSFLWILNNLFLLFLPGDLFSCLIAVILSKKNMINL